MQLRDPPHCLSSSSPTPPETSNTSSLRAARASLRLTSWKLQASTTSTNYLPAPSSPQTPFTFFSFPVEVEEEAQGLEHFPAPKERLPVFHQLCGEAVPGTHLQDPGQGLKKLPDAKAPREDVEGGRMRQAGGCPLSRKGTN